MGRPDEALGLLQRGLDPIAIAREMRITVATVLDYLDRKVGQGGLRRSDIYFSLSGDVRRDPPTREYREVVDRYSDALSAFGDMYLDLYKIETWLHQLIGNVLQQELGAEEAAWWRRGVPEAARVKCAERRERDTESYCEPFAYTDLMDLSGILEHNWACFVSRLPSRVAANRPLFLRDLRRLNSLRNRVMHPVRGSVPTEEDFEFARGFRRMLEIV